MKIEHLEQIARWFEHTKDALVAGDAHYAWSHANQGHNYTLARLAEERATEDRGEE